jgi:hypothetical protein
MFPVNELRTGDPELRSETELDSLMTVLINEGRNKLPFKLGGFYQKAEDRGNGSNASPNRGFGLPPSHQMELWLSTGSESEG